MFTNKIDKFDDIDNQIETNRTELLELNKEFEQIKKKIDNKDNEINNKLLEKRDYGIQRYLNKEYRSKLLNEAGRLGYSKQKIGELEKYIDEWNQDLVTLDIIGSFYTIEQFIKDNQEAYRKSGIYKLGKIFDFKRGNINEN